MITKPYRNFSVSTDYHGVVTVSIDVPDRPMNVLTAEVMSEFVTIVGDLERAIGVTAVVFRSEKESGFLAGADVAVIAGIKSPQEASELIQAGQRLFNRIESLPIPTIVAIHGPCLGGGLEWSLACDYRIARDNTSTKIGLPEIQLGLIPGWGGTQRLPRRIGLSRALPLILTGKHLNASAAIKVGLVDRAISPDHWDHGVAQFVDDVVAGRVTAGHSAPLWRRLLDGTRIGRALTVRMSKRAIRTKSKHYPALESAIGAASVACKPNYDGYGLEESEFLSLLFTPTCRNLLGLYFARERARKPSTWSRSAGTALHHEPIRKVGIVGAGAMGAGIGQLAATRGYDVMIKEIDDKSCRAGSARINTLIHDLATRKRWGSFERDLLRAKIQISTELSSLEDCDLVIEAVVERADAKANVFAQLDSVAKPTAILASNTSSLSITAMGDATHRSHHVAGLHFFNPVHRMELVEVIRGRDTDDETMARLVQFVKAMGKTPVVTTDTPGFLVNRVLFPYLGEAITMVGERHDTAEIDREIRRFGMPMGPLELLDQVGIDVAADVAESLRGVIENADPAINQLKRMVQHGMLGRKSGEGFYRYVDEKRQGATMMKNKSTENQSNSSVGMINDGLTPITRRLIYPMLIEAVRCHQQHVVSEAWAIDLAMVLGTGFAPHRGGPMKMIETIGLETVAENTRRLARIHGSRFSAACFEEAAIDQPGQTGDQPSIGMQPQI
ncbi:3-hydroxyacyl-CoA dehydrogenase NAD-binding domain-containing protein [Rubripirellula reticaptiva]|uniref:enoyl-CoA hydratase n=1 Tax=Rubripirellula reticaptiva TaxID=2528013 RepID=A0A5C6F446_9BACT|nr:3-hydroxyacyl-CoA dehydrogenase NAD-binding domain-containing protein [Rubripirellula reticaptiva]TWU55300.1 Fatty acid oxidation complex subunit alpha [Rubripirellula reticaptiva]